ncbi:MAG: thermonuclease family protein [Candidatus Omnitrophica bacterium]|nr:thermonuclease family protein [Candidatus Omnitrophota bacterium]
MDDVFVNAELVKEGYARVFTFPPNVKHTDFFLKLQRKARQTRKGLWGR